MESTHTALTHLLIVAADHQGANRLISSLRQERLPLRAANALSEGELTRLLSQEQWDVLVCFDNGHISLDRVLVLCQQQDQYFPLILVSTREPVLDPLPLFRQGVHDCVHGEDSRYLPLAVLRASHQQSLQRQLRKLELNQQELEKRHDLLLSTSTTPVGYLQDGVHLYCNYEYARFFGYDTAATAQVKPFLNLVSVAERERLKAVMRQAAEQEQTLTVQALRADGSELAAELQLVPVDYHGKACLQVRVAAAAGNPAYSETVTRLNNQDLVTRVFNRTHFVGLLEAAIRKAVQHGNFSTLIVVEIADFDDVQTAIGSSDANFLLNDIAHFLQDVAKGDKMVGRLEAAQFGLLLDDGNPDVTLQLTTLVKERCNSYLSAAMPNSLTLQCHVGMTLVNGHASNSDTLLLRARNWLVPTAIESGQQTRMVEATTPNAGDMLDYLTLALAERRFTLYFQPIVHIRGGGNHGYEVLIRMLDREGNEIRPGGFLPLAILNGMGEAIDRMVASLVISSVTIATNNDTLVVNITSNTLASPTFLPWLSEQLAQHRFPAGRLMLDLSEIDFHANIASAYDFCQNAVELGLRIAISHFGTAVDAFSILGRVRPGFVTLDESVVRDIVYSNQQKLSVQQLITALHANGTLVGAPQVEDMDVLPVLWGVGADFVQGYCLQAPTKDMNYAFVQEEEITLSALPQ